GWVKDKRAFLRFPGPALLIFFAAWWATGVRLSQPSSQLLPWAADGRILLALIAFMAGAYLFACIVEGQGLLSRLLDTPFFAFLGAISYSFYLWHPIVIVVVKRLVLGRLANVWPGLAGDLVFVSLSIGGSLLFGWLSWRLCE